VRLTNGERYKRHQQILDFQISPEAAEKDKWREGPAQPFEKARFAEGKSLDFTSLG